MREPQHLRPYDSVLDTIGWTPLIRLAKIGGGIRTPVFAKPLSPRWAKRSPPNNCRCW